MHGETVKFSNVKFGSSNVVLIVLIVIAARRLVRHAEGTKVISVHAKDK